MKAEAWTLVTAAAEEPLNLAEMKEHLRVDASDEDALIADYVMAARAWAETYTGRALVTQTWEAHYRCWPGSEGFVLPLPPLASVTSIKYTPEGAAQATLATSVYQVITQEEPGRIILKWDQEWPSEALDVGLPIVVRYVCGYGAAAAVPAGIKQGIRWLVGHYHENRETVTMANVMPQVVPMTARWALDPYRLHYVW